MGFSHGYGALPPKEDAIRLIRMTYEMAAPILIQRRATEQGPMKHWWARLWLRSAAKSRLHPNFIYTAGKTLNSKWKIALTFL